MTVQQLIDKLLEHGTYDDEVRIVASWEGVFIPRDVYLDGIVYIESDSEGFRRD